MVLVKEMMVLVNVMLVVMIVIAVMEMVNAVVMAMEMVVAELVICTSTQLRFLLHLSIVVAMH